MKIYFNEYNIPMGNTVYLPLASGMLRSYAEQYIKEFEFMPFIFKRDTVDNLVAKNKNPKFVCFSVSIWNYNLSIAVARKLKKKYPKCWIIFGGPSVPKKLEYPIDHIIHGAGEHQFASLVHQNDGEISIKYPLLKKEFPSPYLTGQFDYLLNDGTNYQAIIETNRGCPNHCAYCFWGNGQKKMEFFDMQRIKKEAEWMGRNKIKYVFCADSNFGMFNRDIEISQIYADVKAKYGYPEKFRVCYGKSEKESIFKCAQILSKTKLAKAITMSRQTNNNVVALNVGRKNIKKDVFDRLQKKYEDEKINTYSEFILGLPGETRTSFIEGIKEITKIKTKLFIYHCTILPNTEMSKPEYQEKHGIKTVQVPISEIHCSPRSEGSIQEYEDIIIETKTMNKYEWIKCTVYSWKIQLRRLHPTRKWKKGTIQNFFKIAKDITQGKARGQIDLKFGNIYWEPEELAYLHIMYTEKEGDPIEFAKRKILYKRK